MTDRAEEVARKLIRENTDDVEEYADLEFAIAAAIRASAEEARRETWIEAAAIVAPETSMPFGSAVSEGARTAAMFYAREFQRRAAEAALSEVPLAPGVAVHIPSQRPTTPCVFEPDGLALAAAAREWMRERMPTRVQPAWDTRPDMAKGYNTALADVARALGLESTT